MLCDHFFTCLKNIFPQRVFLQARFRLFSGTVEDFQSTTWFSEKSRSALVECITDFLNAKIDLQLTKLMEAEYKLFQIIERRLSQNEISRLFKSIDDFLSTAAKIMNRRKARAGRSLFRSLCRSLSRNNILVEPA
jgi:hypothetical protein